MKNKYSLGLIYNLKYIKTVDGKVLANTVKYAQAKVEAFKQVVLAQLSSLQFRALAFA